jgi:hypothetical protein
MNTRHTPRTPKQAPLVDGFMAALLVEREELQEEVKQLNAAVQIYAEIVRRLETGDSRRAA